MKEFESLVPAQGLIAIAFCVLAGCQSSPVQPQAKDDLRNSFAIVSGKAPLILYEVDDVPGEGSACTLIALLLPRAKVYNSCWDGEFAVRVKPGSHTFKVDYGQSNAQRKVVTIDARDGKQYLIKARGGMGVDWTPEVFEVELKNK